MELSTKIRLARQAAGLTQKDLAAAVGVSLRTINYWEIDGRAPDTANLVKIASATKQPITYFLEEATT